MQAFWLNLLFTAIRQIVTAELFAQILVLVELQTDSKLSGVEKKAAVLKQLKAIQGSLSLKIASLASFLLSAAVDIAVVEVNKKLGAPLTK